MIDWFRAKDARRFPVLGAVAADGALMGFATYGTFRAWPAYKYTVEHSVYVHEEHRRKGVARALMARLIAVAEQQDYHVMVGGIDATNAASIALHEQLGFERAGVIRTPVSSSAAGSTSRSTSCGSRRRRYPSTASPARALAAHQRARELFHSLPPLVRGEKAPNLFSPIQDEA